MNGVLTRIAAMALKELQVVLLDRRVLTTVLFSPIIQLILLGFATTLEVKRFDLGVVNRDSGTAAEQFLAAVAAVPNVRSVRLYANEAAVGEAIERREVLVATIIPSDLSRRIARGETGEIGLLLDGRRINAAQVVAGYLGEVAQRTGATLRPDAAAVPQLAVRHWYNPNLEFRWFTLPGMLTMITTAIVLSVSAQAFAREREFGTWDELMALPLRQWEILLGKCVPATLIGTTIFLSCGAVVLLVSDVPFSGSLPMLVLAVICFSLSVTTVGLSVSTLAQNQQQAFLGGFLVIVPMMLLGGYTSPVDSMPPLLQSLARIDPLSHMLVISHGVFLKEMPAPMVASHIWPMVAVALCALTTAIFLLKWRSE